MATSSSSPSTTLTASFRAAQARRAAIVAALVAQYYRTRVNVEDPSTIESWLALMVPRILGERDTSARQAAIYGNALRRLELPKATDGFNFEPRGDLDAAVVRASLSAVGVGPVRSKHAEIRKLDAPPATRQAMVKQADDAAATRVAGSVVRHVQNGGRSTLQDGVRRDRLALGYVRVTKDDPCYFCAMLASRGPTYKDDSFDHSDPRFQGEGDEKVHDWCGCSLKPVYRRDDDILSQSKRFEDLWSQASHNGGGRGSLIAFRRLYEGRD